MDAQFRVWYDANEDEDGVRDKTSLRGRGNCCVGLDCCSSVCED